MRLRRHAPEKTKWKCSLVSDDASMTDRTTYTAEFNRMDLAEDPRTLRREADLLRMRALCGERHAAAVLTAFDDIPRGRICLKVHFNSRAWTG